MAPRKKKEKDEKEPGDSGSALILEYLSKQMVYHAIQQVDANDPTGNESNDSNQATKDLEEQISALKIREKDLREMLAKANAVIPLSVLKDQIANLEEKKALLTSQVSTLSAEMQESSSCVCKEDFDRIDLEWRKWHAQVTSRKRIFLEFWSRCTEVLPEDMTPGDLKETLGIEGSF
ncbi:TBP interacting domain protein [Talaromyces pinophilus]|uniref:TBP interacting domain protein n=1 Tax=Talaromyces pinophilus TaxID=128442 RepID=A0A6V8HNM6_TALPI|nr:TBP interacting domain protein [Talaromyces pinophilus]